jgi:hypothetical protein
VSAKEQDAGLYNIHNITIFIHRPLNQPTSPERLERMRDYWSVSCQRKRKIKVIIEMMI